MRKFFLFAVFLPLRLFAQVLDDFTDGDFTHDPAWSGDLAHFKLSSSSAVPEAQQPALQLNAPEGGISVLTVDHIFNGNLEWHFWVKLSFNTSSGNFARVYLFTDRMDLEAPLNGYYLQIGGAEDSVLFFRQDSLETQRLLSLDSLFTGNSTNALRIKVFRSDDGTWKFFADQLGGNSLDFQGETNDLAYSDGSYFGIYCQYTSSNISKIYFDDFYAGPLIVDSISPSLLKADALSPTEILLTFSEAVDQQSAENTSHYDINPDLGHPYSAIRLLDPARVHLFFDQAMQNEITYTLNVSSIKDPAGNETGLITLPVRYYRIAPYDLVFTEIMADPSPPNELPELEYLEILNRSLYPLDLISLTLTISSTVHELPSFTIDPGNYVLLCDNDVVQALVPYGDVIGFPSFVLPNSGTQLHLADTSGMTICNLQYSISWYNDYIKSEGGWSLEMIDPANPCKNEGNWMASEDPSGGTPGRENSVSDSQYAGMKIIKTCCLNELEIEIAFNEALDSLSAAETSLYLAKPTLGAPSLAIPLGPDFRSVKLLFDEAFSLGQIYELTVQPGIQNCIGDVFPSDLQSFFALDQAVEAFDIIINEILFNPLGDGVDYVEIYNRSAKAIDLKNLDLASVKIFAPNPPDTQNISIAASCITILPSEYLVLTSDPQKVRNQYYTSDPDAFLELSSFPSYNNDKGYVLLMDRDKRVIDGLNYSEDMHFLLLNSMEGVSLERISQDRLGDDPTNWHSAAETAGFGTPGYRNSQYLEFWDDEAEFSLQPEIFSPDGDGWNDHLGILYHFGSPGKLINILIFNADGRPVRTLVNNELPGTHGIYSWDGTQDDRTPAQNGIYVIFAEVLGMDGKTRHYKKAGVLARNR